MKYLQRFVASQDQYLIVQHRAGHKEHIPGSVPVQTISITSKFSDVGDFGISIAAIERAVGQL